MLEPYSLKLIKSGKFVEIFEYANPIYRLPSRSREKLFKKYVFIDPDNDFRVPRNDNLVRSRMHIRRLINSNPQLSKFITLTYNYPQTNFKQSNTEFNKFVKRLKYNKTIFDYITVTEIQKKNTQNIHYHMLSDLPFIHNTDLRNIWRQGFVKINQIDNIHNVGLYLSKYLNKQFTDERFFNVKKYFYSRGLKQPSIYKEDGAFNYLEFFQTDIKIDYSCSFYNDFTGKINYYSGYHQSIT